jgi:Zn-dependent M28 family amino/carboxypeptidase
VILVAFDAEEVGLFGSRAFVAAPPVPAGNILLNINLDMLGRADQGALWAAGPRIFPALLPAVNAAARASGVPLQLGLDYRPAQKFRGGEDWTTRSDQASFAAAGIPFIFFTTGEASDYHRPSDDAERIDAPFFGKVVATVLDVLRRLDAADGALRVARRHGGRPRWRNPG